MIHADIVRYLDFQPRSKSNKQLWNKKHKNCINPKTTADFVFLCFIDTAKELKKLDKTSFCLKVNVMQTLVMDLVGMVYFTFLKLMVKHMCEMYSISTADLQQKSVPAKLQSVLAMISDLTNF